MHHFKQARLMNTLKDAIQENHARMEALPFISALSNGTLPLESYVGQLRAMAAIHGTLEHEIELTAPSPLKTLMMSLPSRLIHLRKDLSVFDPQMVPDIAAALVPTRIIAERIRRSRVEQPDDLFGILYVMQGNALGNAVHLPDVLKIFGGLTGGTAHYYSGYGPETARYWNAFRNVMNALPMDPEARARLVQAALDTFDQLEALFSALYPIENTTMMLTASMLNPEAGDHAVPCDTREMQAAVVAAEKCREEFPYFDERYQERGRSFSKSDSAWLATLTELSATQLLVQVEWLGRVLGNRGMPRITLERQLILLHTELANAVPEKMAHYAELLEAAESLKRERLRHLPEPSFTRLVREFQNTADNALLERLRNMGDLIVSAVCDEATGVSAAVSSLLSWLTDEQRFPSQWIEAVLHTVNEARKEVATSKQD